MVPLEVCPSSPGITITKMVDFDQAKASAEIERLTIHAITETFGNRTEDVQVRLIECYASRFGIIADFKTGMYELSIHLAYNHKLQETGIHLCTKADTELPPIETIKAYRSFTSKGGWDTMDQIYALEPKYINECTFSAWVKLAREIVLPIVLARNAKLL